MPFSFISLRCIFCKKKKNTLRFVLNFDRGHGFSVTKYDGGGPFQVLGVLPCVSKHKMLLNLIGKESADCLMVNSPQCGQRVGGCPWHPRGQGWNCETVMYRLSSHSSVWLASMETDTLIIILSETKIGNRSHNNRCVNFHGHDLQCALGLKIQTESRSEWIMILTLGVVRGFDTNVTLMLTNT